MTKPSVFVGSSSEGLEFARGVRSALSEDAETTLWNEGFFVPDNTFIETLLNSLPRFDFAVLVLTPDDWVRSRDVESIGPRDNVLFELGLFMGRLGRSRTFMLHQAGAELRMPTDLAGVTMATYEWPRNDRSHRSAVGPACDRIRETIRDLGISETKVPAALVKLESRQDHHERTLMRQEAELRWLQVALQGIITDYELDKLVGLNRDEPFLCYYSEDLFNEIKRLRAMGLVHHKDGFGLRAMKDTHKDRDGQFDLKHYFFITERGKEYLTLRRQTLSD